MKKICERLLLKPVQISPGLPFFDNLHFWLKLVHMLKFCIIIYSIVCHFPLHYYWYCYNKKQSSSGVLQKTCYYKFRKIHKKTPALKTCFCWSSRSTELITYRNFLVNSAKFLATLFLENPLDGCFRINTRSVYYPTTTVCFFQKRCHIYFLAEYFLGLNKSKLNISNP